MCKLKKVLLPLILSYIYTLQFLSPSKSYPVLVVSKFKEVVLDFKTGYLKDYALNTSNLFLIIIAFFAVRSILKAIMSGAGLKKYLRDNKLLLIIFLGCAFLVEGSISSFARSPFFMASIVWLMQYSQIYWVGLVIYLVCKNRKEDFMLILHALSASIVFQSILSMLQFAKQSSLGLIFERVNIAQWSVGDNDIIGSVYRVYGTFSHPNELGLIMTLMLCVILPYIFEKKNRLFVLSVVLGGITIVLSQSRSSWVALASALLIFLKIYYSEFKKLISELQVSNRVKFYFLSVFVVVLFIIIPRILLSTNIFYQSGAVDLRVEMLKESLEAIKLSPLFGFGVGTNEVVFSVLFPKGFIMLFPSSVHIGFIQLILEIGIIGFTVFVAPFIVMLYLFQRNLYLGLYKSTDKKYLFTFMAGFLAFVLYYLFQPHWGQFDFAYLGVILGVGMLGLINLKRKV